MDERAPEGPSGDGAALELTPPPTPPGPPAAGPARDAGAAASAGASPPSTPPASGPGPLAPPPAAPPAPMASALDRLPGWTVPAVLVGIPVLAWLLTLAVPAFYDQVIWRYYWGPIKADAGNFAQMCSLGGADWGDRGEGLAGYLECRANGGVLASSGYNWVNTASWAVLMGLCILGVAQILRRTGTAMEPRLIFGATGWVVAGSVFHVMEDASLFRAPLQYVFITPPIYLLFTAGGVLSLVVAHYLRRVGERATVGIALQKMWMLCSIPVVLYLLAWVRGWDQVAHYVNPVWVALFMVAGFALAARRARALGRIDPVGFVGHMAVPWLLLAVRYIIGFVQAERAGAPWFDSHDPLPVALWSVPLAAGVALVAFLVGLVGVGRAERAGRKKARDFAFAWLQPVNLLLLFSQMLDAFATSIGIDLGHYTEKHRLSANIIDWTRALGERTGVSLLEEYPTFLGFAPIKLLVSLFVVYAIDVSGQEDAKRNSTVVGLVKLAIIMVGLGPGIRDFVRMALGV